MESVQLWYPIDVMCLKLYQNQMQQWHYHYYQFQCQYILKWISFVFINIAKGKKAYPQSTELFNTYCVVLYFDHTKLELIVLLSPKVDCRTNSLWFLTNITLVISKNFNHSFLTVTVKESVQVLQPAAASVFVTGPSLVEVVPSIVNVSKSNLNLHISEIRSYTGIILTIVLIYIIF